MRRGARCPYFEKGIFMQALGLSWEDNSAAGFHETPIVKERPAHHGARLLLENWAAQKQRFVVGRDVPSRALAKVLSGLALYEPEGGDFRVRLAGMGLRRRFGRDVTGERLSVVLGGAQFETYRRPMERLLATGKPLVVEMRMTEEGRTKLCFELVALRVFAPDGETPWVMSGIFFHDWRL
jgi:hypothetical protein